MLETRKTLLIIVLLLALGLVMVLAMNMMVSMETGTIAVALLVPLLAYLLLSGAIAEFGFGGVNAKFNRAASTAMTLADVGPMMPSSGDFDQVGEEGSAAVQHMLDTYKLSEARPIVLNLKLGRGDYEQEQTLGFITQLSAHRSFKLVTFLDRHDRVVAYMPFWAARLLLLDREEGERFISTINDNQVGALLDYPQVDARLLRSQDTNAQALRQMRAQNLEALVVVDADGRLKGVVERDDVVSSMMLALVAQ